MKFFWLFLTLIVTSVQTHAGYLELTNGDRAEGEFVRLEGDSVIWKSTNFGELNIKKNKVKNISLSRYLTLYYHLLARLFYQDRHHCKRLGRS